MRRPADGMNRAHDTEAARMLAVPLAVLLVATLLAATPPVAGSSPTPASHCLDTTVTVVETYFAHDPESGWDVSFAGRIYDPYVGTQTPHLTDRGGTDYGVIHTGDRVHVCLVDSPKPDDPGCDPHTDLRGRVYSVWDGRLRRTFSAPNSGHLCGGA